MGLPAPYKTYQAPVTVSTTLRGNAVLNAHEAAYLALDALISLGFTSKGAGTTSSAGLDGRRLTARGDWVNAIGSGKVTWWCLEDGNGAQFCLANNGDNGTDYANFVMTYSADGGYTGGSTTAAPTAPHMVSVSMSSAPWGSGGGGHGADVYTARIIASTDAKNVRLLWFIGTFGFGLWAFEHARGARAGWSGNYLMNDQFGVNGATLGGLIDNFQNGPGAGRIYTYANGNAIGGAGVGAFATSDIRGDNTTLWVKQVTTVNGLTGLYDISSVRIGVPGSGTPAVRGRFGVAPDMYLVPRLTDGSATPKFTSGSTAPLAGTREWITFGDLLIYWGGGAVNGDVGDFDYFDDNGGCVCPELPAPTLLEDVAGGASRPNVGPSSFGQDIDAIVDVPLRWGLASGYRNLGNALARRLAFIRSLLNAGLTDAELAQIRKDAVAALVADERVRGVAKMGFVFTSSTSTLAIDVTVETADGPFSTIYAVSPAGVTEVR